MLKKIQYFVLFFIFHHFIAVNSQTSENNDCFEKGPKEIKKLHNSQEESLNAPTIDDDLMTEFAHDLPDLSLETQSNQQEILEYERQYLNEVDLQRVLDVNLENNYQILDFP